MSAPRDDGPVAGSLLQLHIPKTAGRTLHALLERHFDAEPVTGHHLPSEFRVVHAAQRDSGQGQKQRRRLRERLDHQDAGQERLARKVPLEELFTDGDVLDHHDPLAGLVLDDLVYEE